jgi:branched-chain amino acid aminotransferase
MMMAVSHIDNSTLNLYTSQAMQDSIPYLDNPAWFNGQECKVRDLSVSILDLGLIHSDATYDVMAFINGNGFEIDAHLARFIRSCQSWRLPLAYSQQELAAAIQRVHDRTGWLDSIIWISVTRGIPRSGNPRDLANAEPNLMIYAKPYQKFNGTNQATVCESQTAVRVPDCSINQNNKNFVWNDLTQAQWEAIDRGFDTAIVFGTTGLLTEGPGFNVAIIKNNQVLAPRTNRLPGISMLKVEQLCQQYGIDFQWADIDKQAVDACDDMFLTTTIGNLVTVTNYNGRVLTPSRIQEQLIELLNIKGK